MTLPYENATSGERSLGEIQKLLRGFGCSKFGSMSDDEAQEILIQFEYRGRPVSVKASIRGYVPFYLAHPRLCRLEHRMSGEVEGGTPEWCMKLLRHEAGHCFDHLWRVSRQPRWRELFGAPERVYDPECYDPDEASRDFVMNLPGHYAQAHPDEDFAETFAVWLSPHEDWKTRYASWPKALAKLEYVDGLARQVGPKRPRQAAESSMCRASRLRRRLAEHYARRLGVARRTVWELGRASSP